MKTLLLLTLFFIIANCTNKLTIDHHGVHKLYVKQEKIFPNETNKNDIIKILGPPSSTSFFDNEVLFFIERKETTGPIETHPTKSKQISDTAIMHMPPLSTKV